MSRIYTVADAADLVNLSERQVRHLAQIHGIGRKIGLIRTFSAADLRRLRRRPPRGRPPNTTPQRISS